MNRISYVNRCIWCGKFDSRCTSATAPGNAPPVPAGICPSSPDGRHKPKWEQDTPGGERTFVNRCVWCGKFTSRTKSGSFPAMVPPKPGGRCPSSPDGTHKPKWEEL